ncbi:unnamed protein product [Adineta steineri]|uniref:Uncharacterized protein n=1 Tax=Adineta steineri TaxID=433720 RepID=A0A814U950_9BILA|nr:unnamed protein product [Adineta steineri]CAF1287680.1 unnamed protein product [Adineta steineri]
MQTIDNIQFDDNLYIPASYWTVLLCQQNGVSVAVPLPNANLMSFIRVFDDTALCQNYVETNLRKLITLFGWDENMQQWLANATSIPDNLQEIKIFCNSSDRLFVNAWARRHLHRFNNTTFEIINCDKLNYGLLLFGVDYLKKLDSDYPPNSPLQMQLRLNYKRICRALANYFLQEADA